MSIPRSRLYYNDLISVCIRMSFHSSIIVIYIVWQLVISSRRNWQQNTPIKIKLHQLKQFARLPLLHVWLRLSSALAPGFRGRSASVRHFRNTLAYYTLPLPLCCLHTYSISRQMSAAVKRKKINIFPNIWTCWYYYPSSIQCWLCYIHVINFNLIYFSGGENINTIKKSY